MSGDVRWNPWAALRARPYIELEWAWLRDEGGHWVLRENGLVTIYLDPRLSQRERRCVLAHELVHDERRISYPPGAPQLLIDFEERFVWKEAARRLVPAEELLDLVARCAPTPLELWEISDHFDVDRRVARLACEEARRRSVLDSRAA